MAARDCRDLEHAYVYWIWLRGSASYVIKLNRKTEYMFSISFRKQRDEK